MNLQEIDLRNVYRIWKSDLGPFQGFFRSTPFVSFQTYDDFKLDTENIGEYDQKVLDIIIENVDESNFLISYLILFDHIHLYFLLV